MDRYGDGIARARLSSLARRGDLLWVALITLAGGALRFGGLGSKTLWLDEAFSLWMVGHSPQALLGWLVHIDHHPPLYYLLLHGWVRWLGDSTAAIRSLSALCSTLTLPIFYWAGRRLVGRRAALTALTLLALAPFHVRYAQEARMYALLTLAVALLLLALATVLAGGHDAHDAYGQKGRRPWAWGALAATQAAAMLTHNTTTVLVPLALNLSVAGVAGYAWWRSRRRSVPEPSSLGQTMTRRWWAHWAMAQAGALLLWSWWAGAFVQQAQVVDAEFWIASPTVERVWQTLATLTIAHSPPWMPMGWVWPVLGLLPAGLALTLPQTISLKRRAWGLLGLWLLPPVVELLVSMRRPIFYDRTLIWTTLPYLLLVGVGIEALWRRGNRMRYLGRSLLGLWLLGSAAGLYTYFTDFQKEPWDDAAAYVAERAAPGDLILHHASWVELPFDYYWQRTPVRVESGGAEHARVPQQGVPVDLFARGMLEPPMTEGDAPRLRRQVAGYERVWLVYSHWWYTDPQGLVPATLAEEYTHMQEAGWPGIRVLRFEN